MEPVCKPSTGPMRAEHDPDEDGICRACGDPGTVAPSPSPRPAPRPIVATFAERAAEQAATYPGAPKARPGRGAVTRPKEHQRITLTRPSATLDPAQFDRAIASRTVAVPPPYPSTPAPVEDVARVVDPIQAALAAMELERDELDVAIEVLRRQVARRKASA